MRTFVRSLLVVVLVSCLGALAIASPQENEKITLKVGDAPPPLQATKWLTGSEVKVFEPGKIYVVEFWATWCGPCVVMMPHLGDLQQELGSKATIIGFSAVDPGNTPEQIETFVQKRGDKLGYTIAYADNRDTYEAYMTASGHGGIPCSYVIGKDGKIAFIGHPLFLEEVLPKVLDGSWEPTKGAAELEAADKLWDATYAAISKPGDADKQLAQWEEFNSKWPHLANDPYMNAARLKLLVTAKKFADAENLASKMVTHAAKRNDLAAYGVVAEACSADKAISQPKLAALGIEAAEAAVKIDGETVTALIRLTKVYAANGNAAKVREYGPKAVEAAEKALTGDDDVMGTLKLAAAYFAAGDKAQAKETAEKAISLVDARNGGMKQYIEEQAKQYGAEPMKETKEKGDKKEKE
jgi:thiol-disulfide isomerase/thioredoxin